MSRIRVALASFLSVTCLPSLAQAVTSGEVYTTTAYTYGRFEARLRFAAGDGVVSSFFLWKDGSEVSGTFWNELDFEKLGADCRVEMNSIFGVPSVNHIQRITPEGDAACAAYHTYAYEWTPDYIAWLIDGVELRRDTGANAAAYADNAASGMQMRLNVWPGDATFGGNFSPDILPVHQYVDWVQFSSYDAGAFTLAWREDFNGTALPTGWATATWGSPKNLSTHDPRNVNLVGGALVISLTADDATGPAGAVPGLDGSGGVPSAGGSGGMDGLGGTGTAAGSGGTDSAGSGGTDASAGTASSTGGTSGVGGAGGSDATGGRMEPPGTGGGGAPSSSGATAVGGGAGAGAQGGGVAQGGAPGVGGMQDNAGSGAAKSDAPESDGGCSVSTPGSPQSYAALVALGLCGVGLLIAARRR